MEEMQDKLIACRAMCYAKTSDGITLEDWIIKNLPVDYFAFGTLSSDLDAIIRFWKDKIAFTKGQAGEQTYGWLDDAIRKICRPYKITPEPELQRIFCRMNHYRAVVLFRNLIVNSYKYATEEFTEARKKRVVVKLYYDESSQMAVATISNTGDIIEPERLDPSVPEKFIFNLDVTTGGTGLGLFETTNMITQLNGAITLEPGDIGITITSADVKKTEHEEPWWVEGVRYTVSIPVRMFSADDSQDRSLLSSVIRPLATGEERKAIGEWNYYLRSRIKSSIERRALRKI